MQVIRAFEYSLRGLSLKTIAPSNDGLRCSELKRNACSSRVAPPAAAGAVQEQQQHPFALPALDCL